ncbi:hypothetical protein JCM3774_003192 [Rhodotorula dairenensis]
MTGLTAKSWVALVTYAVVMGLVVRGIRIPVPRAIAKPALDLAVALRLLDPPQKTQFLAPGRRLSVPLDLRWAPVVGVLFLLATTVLPGDVVRLGIVGDDSVRPYDVLVLFIALAYISTALDSTGGLRALSFWISQKSAKAPPNSPPSAPKTASGLKLWTVLYAFWFFFGVLVGNDPIVLSGTAFLGYFTRATGITAPRAWIMSQFVAANVASAALVSSNPTNILIAGAWNLNFLTGFTAYTILPTAAVGIVAYPVLLGMFTFLKPHSPADKDSPVMASRQRYIPEQLLPPDVDPRSALVDPQGAIFHATLLLVTLGTLVGTSFVSGVEVWMITMPAGILAFLRDIWSERKAPKPIKKEEAHEAEIELEAAGGGVRVKPAVSTESTTSSAAALAESPTAAASTTSLKDGVEGDRRYSLPSLVRATCDRFPTTTSTISRLPLSLLTFAGGIFVLARGLTETGWTDTFAGWLVKICVNPAATVFFVGYFTALVLCPVCGTNIGGTILAVEIIRSPTFANSARAAADPRILSGAIYSLAMASNIGALSWTISSSLAGLLWVRILQQKGIRVTQVEFARWMVPLMLVLSTVASAIVLVEINYWNLGTVLQ